MHAFRTQVNHFVDVKIRGSNMIERLYAEYLPVPFLSLLIDDCIANGKDYNAGGARYNTSYIQGVGIGTRHGQPLGDPASTSSAKEAHADGGAAPVLAADFAGQEKTRLLTGEQDSPVRQRRRRGRRDHALECSRSFQGD